MGETGPWSLFRNFYDHGDHLKLDYQEQKMKMVIDLLKSGSSFMQYEQVSKDKRISLPNHQLILVWV